MTDTPRPTAEDYAQAQEEAIRYAESRKKEKEVERELALRLIAIGYRQLRKELRPIKGKPEPWEKQLRQVRNHLKKCVPGQGYY
jgi:hypothetical protein